MNAVAHAPLRAASLFSTAGKKVVVTGGGRGIGLMIARAFVENGAHVVIASRTAVPLGRAADALSALGPGAPRWESDLRDD
jgi:NAD(P)-dependent dehydrogenase (short-subunit alcohol dehydrogenase family)